MERDKQPLDDARNLEQIIDELDEKVAREREEQGIPGNRGERLRDAGNRGNASEPPD